MLITPYDVEYLDELLLAGYPAELADFLIQRNFHFFLACGFDEVRAETRVGQPNLWGADLKDDLNIDIINTDPREFTCNSYVYNRMESLRFRQENSGAWYRLQFTTGSDPESGEFSDRYMYCFGELDEKGRSSVVLRSVEILDWIRKAASTVSPRCSLLLLPDLLKGRSMTESVPISEHIRDLIVSLHNNQIDLRSVHWRDLEEVVAELLRSKGLKVEVTPRTRDGGRDIVARGELIPGEPSVLAVEVKQRAITGIEDVQRALHANRNFPALLFATAGRFTAGVIREARQGDTAFRLLLKDGVGLSQWIRAYANRLQDTK